MTADKARLGPVLSDLDKPWRFTEVDPNAAESAVFVEAHLEKAVSSLRLAERLAETASPAVVSCAYQVLLSVALVALRRAGVAVKPARALVDFDAFRAARGLLRLGPHAEASTEQLLRVYSRSVDVGPLPTTEEGEAALSLAARALEQLTFPTLQRDGMHQAQDHQSLLMHRAAVSMLRSRPELAKRLEDTLSRWALRDDPNAKPLLERWALILETADWDSALAETEEGQQLRQASPLPTILPAEVRWSIIRSVHQARD
jgi:hypothetical protein